MVYYENVIKIQKRQISRLNELKEIIKRKLLEKIVFMTKQGELSCIFNVPSYYFGYPRYNVEDITDYLISDINNNKLLAFKLSQSKLFICWDINCINKFNSSRKDKKVNFKNILPIVEIKKNILR